MSGPRPRVALVSVGLGRVQRGFERYFADLFAVLQRDIDVTLFRSAGAGGIGERVPPLLKPLTRTIRALPLSALAGRAEYNRDCLAFALAMLPDLRKRRFDVIHCIDPPMAFALRRLQRWTRFPGRLLFTEGCVMPPGLYPPVDHVHHVARAAYEAAAAAGIAPARMSFVPCGLDPQRFVPPGSRDALRACHQIAGSTFVVLVVSAVKRDHKRVDHVIDEVARLDGDVLLWIDGNPEDQAVVDLATRCLGRRCRITHVSSADVPQLYGLADVLVQASLAESFGLAIVEAMTAGLPVLVHDSPHFRWLVADPACLVDMSARGALGERLAEIRRRPDGLRAGARGRAARVRERFDWNMLAPEYVAMYRQVASVRLGQQTAPMTGPMEINRLG